MTTLTRLAGGSALLLDGGLGSMLIARGLPAGSSPDHWTLERPDEIAAVHRAWVEAGSEVVHANTFGANPLRLAAHGLAGRCAEVNDRAVALARASGARFVWGDVGPTGEYLPPVGKGDPDAWAQCFATQGRALFEAGVDALHIETMSDKREALAALRALHEVAPGTPILASLTLDRRGGSSRGGNAPSFHKKRGFFTIMGDPAVPSLTELARAGADAVGANCSVASAELVELAEALVAAVGVPLILQPNAGQPRVTPGGVEYDQTPEAFAEDLARMVGLGVRAVGGCCGTDPRFIAAARARLGL